MQHRSCIWPGSQKTKPVPWDDQTTLSQTPICRTHPTSSLPGWMTLQPAGVSCAEGAPQHPVLRPEPQRKSAAAHAGTLPCPGSQPSLAPSVPGLWRRSSAAKVGSHKPADPLQAAWARPETGDRSITLESGHGRRGLMYYYCKWTLRWCNGQIEGRQFKTR